MPSRNKKLFVVLVLAFALVWVGLLILRYVNQTALVVHTAPGAQIFIATEKGGDFEPIGETSAKYVADGPGTVFVQVAQNDQKTLAAVSLPKSEVTEINLELRPAKSSQRIANRALFNLHFEDNFIFGVNPVSRSIGYADTTGDNRQLSLPYISLPFLSKVGWHDRSNFAFFSGKAGAVIKGEEKALTYKRNDGDTGVFINLAKHPDKPMILLGQEGIFSETKEGSFEFIKIAGLESVSSPRIFVDDKQIYLFDYVFQDTDDEGGMPLILETSLKIFDYNGQLTAGLKPLIKEGVNGIVDLESSSLYAVLGETNLIFIDKSTGQTVESPYYFTNTSDLALSESLGLTVLTTEGLWIYDYDQQVYYLAAPFPEGEEYIANSLTLIGEDIYYSTQISKQALRDPNSQAASSVYKLSP